MKFSLKWLKEYVAIRWTPQDLAQRMTLAGLEVSGRQVVEEDVIFECEVTPNRADWLSHVGAAREIAAMAGSKLKLPPAGLPKALSGTRPSITVSDKKGCRRYVGILIEDVKVGPSPKWLEARLKAVGIRSVNNIVDVTNFCLMESGQPLHAFDADRLEKGRIVVRRAAQGEKIVTLDGAERQLTSEMLVIADARRPVAIAGVMGGKDAEVSFGTKRVLLESAWFDPISIRRTSRNLKLASDSSYRFERGVDLEQVASCARRAAALIVEAAGGYVVWGPVDKRFSRNKPKAILWEPEQARALGEEIPPLKQRKIFLALGCRITGSTSRWKVAPPSFRADLKEPVDLLEELARLTGYQNFPTTLPRPAPTFAAQENREGNGEKEIDLRGRENKIRRLLVAGGLDEILTYSLIGPDALQRFDPTGSLKKAQQLFLQNPLSVDLSILRPTLLIGALETVARNFNRRAAAGMALFELGRTYHWDAQGKPEERRTLSIALAGLKTGSWNAKPSCWDLYDAKGILDALSERLGGKKLHWRAWNNQDIDRACPWFRPETVTIGDDARAPRVAWIGITDSRFTAFEIPSNVEVVLAEVGWQACWAAPASPAMLVSLPKVAPVTRDIAVVLDEAVPYSEIASCIRLAGGSLVQKVHLFDQYRGSQVPSGKKSLAYTVTYAAGDRTLTDDEVNQAHASIVEALRGQFAATLRS